jgi:hypothetical protein
MGVSANLTTYGLLTESQISKEEKCVTKLPVDVRESARFRSISHSVAQDLSDPMHCLPSPAGEKGF